MGKNICARAAMRASFVLTATVWLSSASAATISWDATYFNDVGLNQTDFDTFKSSIGTALNYYTSRFQSPNAVQVSVAFHAGNTGLGSTSTFRENVNYQAYRAALAGAATSAADTTALGYLPDALANPVNGNNQLQSTLPLLRALGLGGQLGAGEKDAEVTLNVGLMMLDRTGPADPQKYDLLQVVYHELNEVLGFTSALNGVANTPVTVPTGAIESADLFRYSANGVRSFTSDKNKAAYFSIDGGQTALANFNTNDGGDRQDFNGSPQPSVQDAFSTPGIRLDNGLAERTALDVIGYTYVAPVPVPAAVWLFGSALAAFGFFGRRKNALALS